MYGRPAAQRLPLKPTMRYTHRTYSSGCRDREVVSSTAPQPSRASSQYYAGAKGSRPAAMAANRPAGETPGSANTRFRVARDGIFSCRPRFAGRSPGAPAGRGNARCMRGRPARTEAGTEAGGRFPVGGTVSQGRSYASSAIAYRAAGRNRRFGRPRRRDGRRQRLSPLPHGPRQFREAPGGYPRGQVPCRHCRCRAQRRGPEREAGRRPVLSCVAQGGPAVCLGRANGIALLNKL